MNDLAGYRDVLGSDVRSAWPLVAEAAPVDSVLMGGTGLAIRLRHRRSFDLDLFTTRPFDPDKTEQRFLDRGAFSVEIKDEGTLNGTFNTVRVQVLWAQGQRTLAPPTALAGMSVGSMKDLFATKLNTIAGRAQLRDYFDLMCIEQDAGLLVDEGIHLFTDRFGVDLSHGSVTAIVRGLGFFDDIPEDPGLEETHGPNVRDRVIGYWTRRQPEIVSSII